MQLTIEDFYSIVFNQKEIKYNVVIKEKVIKCYHFLEEFSKNKVIYGINTGFGPMAQYKIPDEEIKNLQYNLIRSHSSGMDNPLSLLNIKASMIARLNTLALGHSGIHISLINLLEDLINKNIYPVIYSHGGVGASGDLVQLAHLALVLIGEGKVYYQGELQNTREVFEKENITPLQIHIREGIAIMNGTSVMTGIGVINSYYTQKLLNISLKCSCAITEIVAAYDDFFSLELNEVKKHKGQRKIAAEMRNSLKDSQLIRKREAELYHGECYDEVFKNKVQEYYSIRCVPQILGPILDTLNQTKKILEEEFNSANDNPIIDMETEHVYHGGNFHGDYVALEMDKLKIAVTKLSMLAERQINFLMNSKINEILPPFINLGTLGLNFGLQGIQFTAVSTTAENQTLSNPMSIHSIPNNNDNQDIVSMGTNAALMCEKIILNTFQILAIESLAIAQAIDYLDIHDKISSSTKKFYREIRAIIPVFVNDFAPYEKLTELSHYLKEH